MMLEVQGLKAGYGRIEALHGVDLDVGKSEIVVLLGANGAGKSTFVKSIMGLLRPAAGQISFEGQPLDELSAAQRIQLGLAVVPEGRQLFPDMSVYENLLLGDYPSLGALVSASGHHGMERVLTLFPQLKDKLRRQAGTLSGGEAQMVTIGRALMSSPRLLLCDEPSLGLAPRVTLDVLHALQTLCAEGLSILLADQNASYALKIADRGYVLDSGEVVASGPAHDLRADAGVSSAYLGT